MQNESCTSPETYSGPTFIETCCRSWPETDWQETFKERHSNISRNKQYIQSEQNRHYLRAIQWKNLKHGASVLEVIFCLCPHLSTSLTYRHSALFEASIVEGRLTWGVWTLPQLLHTCKWLFKCPTLAEKVAQWIEMPRHSSCENTVDQTHF